MSSIKRSFLAAGSVAALAGCVLAGSTLRDRVDLSQPLLTNGRTAQNGENQLPVIADNRLDGMLAARGSSEIPASDFFFELTEKLKKEYVEPIKDEQKLASGAVRGMIGYLGDPESTFMDKDAFRVFMNARRGKYEGVGADFALLTPTPGAKAFRSALQPTPTEESEDPRQQTLTEPKANDSKQATPPKKGGKPSAPRAVAAPQFPRLTVVSVVPGGPADQAGVKAGDIVDSVDDHWVVNGDLIQRFTEARDAFEAKKIDLTALNAIRKEVRDKYERALLPLRARDRLFMGTTDTLKVTWLRDGVSRTTKITRRSSERPGFAVQGNTIRLPLVSGAPEALAKAIEGKSAVTIDLRNNVLGSFDMMKECLAVLAPAGSYGIYATDRAEEKPTPFSIGKGNPNPPKITLITDRTTRGAAEILALALSSKGLAKLTGGETGNDRNIYEIVSLPDGTGYTLVTAHYRTGLASGRVADKGATR